MRNAPFLLLIIFCLACQSKPTQQDSDDQEDMHQDTFGSIERLDPTLDALLPVNAQPLKYCQKDTSGLKARSGLLHRTCCCLAIYQETPFLNGKKARVQVCF